MFRRTPWPECSVLVWGLLAAATGSARAAEPIAPPAPLPLAWCLERAAAENPSIGAAEAGAAAARERIRPAGSLEDPRFGYEASNIPVSDWDFDSTPLSGHQLALAQQLPFPGLLSSRERAAEAGARSEASLLEDRQLHVAARVEGAWAGLGFAQRALDITDRNLDLLRQLTRIAETKYSVGKGLQQDVLRAQVQMTRLLDERLQREAEIERAQASLAALLDLPPDVALPRTADLVDDSPLPSLAALIDSLEQSSPLLQSLASRVEEAERLRRATELASYPDVDLNLGYRLRQDVPGDPVDGADFFSAGVRVRLPVDRWKWNARVAEQGALWRRAKASYREARAQLRETVRSRFADLQRAQREVELLRGGLVPQSRQSLESSRVGYEVDKVDFLSLVDSQVGLLRAELALVRALADRRTAFSALEAAAGRRLR